MRLLSIVPLLLIYSCNSAEMSSGSADKKAKPKTADAEQEIEEPSEKKNTSKKVIDKDNDEEEEVEVEGTLVLRLIPGN